ncbi:MAG: HesA/MoeB/ThiF family protein [Deltaproteobacteria bacterium]
MRQGTYPTSSLPVSEEVFLYSQTDKHAARTRILIVGLGALGCPAALVLAGRPGLELSLLDHDRVEASNLQRQVLFADSDIGRPKVEAAAEALSRGSAKARLNVLVQRLDEHNAHRLVGAHDFVIDATDDPPSKFLINAAAVATRTPYCYGGVLGRSGQTMTIVPGVSACLECVFPADPANLAAERNEAGCSRLGVLASVAGVIGSLQGWAALRATTDVSRPHGHPTDGRMTVYSAAGTRWRQIDFPRDKDCPCCAQTPLRKEARTVEQCHL